MSPLDRTQKKRELKSRTKKSLKKMRQSQRRHPLRNHARIIKYGTSGFARNIWLSTAATIVMTVTLIILFVTVVASVILTSTAEIMKDKIDITVYVQPNLSQETLDEMAAALKEDSNVKSVTISTSAQEYAKLQEENNEYDNLSELMQDEEMQQLVLNRTLGVLRVKVYDTDNLDSVKNIVEQNDLFVRYVDQSKMPSYDENRVEIATITNWANIARNAGMVLAVVFLVISVLIIFSTIRMAIFSRREEIYMEKLVGAEKRFIRGPFLVEAEICGIIAGVLAATISFFGFNAVAPKLQNYGINVDIIENILRSNQLVLVYAVFVALGVLISWLSAWFAISKYLHRT